MITTTVETLDLISQLGRETIVEYLAENKTVEAIVDDLLALQILTPAITKGTISNSIKNLTRSIQVDGDTILRALMRLRETVGGYIEVDNDRKLDWLDSIGEDKGQQIRYRKNLKGIEREIDYSQLFNRIYAYGTGEGDARITLAAPGYVEDTDSQTEWGGIYPTIIIDRSITHPDTLSAWAQLYLNEHKDPPIYYRIDVVDLSQSEELDFSFEALQLGSTITVIDEDLGISVSVIVVKIKHPDLQHPEQMTLELANRTKDITDTLAKVYDTQQLRDHVATKIGAGQVIVLGEFSVIDWVSAGTTYIKGGYIRTGLLESTNWGAGAGSQFNLDDGVFKLGGSSAPKLSWNGSVLGIKGAIIFEAGSEADYSYITGTKPPADAEANPDYIHSTYIDSTQIKSPNISGTTGYFSNIFKVGSAGIVIDGGGKLIKSSNYSAGSAGWQIKNTGDAEFNDVVVRGAIYATSGEFTGTIKTSSIETGKTLTVAGAISVAGGDILLNSDGISVKGERLKLYYGASYRGNLAGTNTSLSLHATTGYNVSIAGNEIAIVATNGDIKFTTSGETGIDMILPDYLLLPRRTSVPSFPSEGMMIYNSSSGYTNIYHGGAWHHLNRDANWA